MRLGQHELLAKLASGGVANVFLVREVTEGPSRLLALKILHPNLANDREYAKMFLAEAAIASQLRHANIVAIAGFGKADGVFSLAMEYVFGVSLGDLLREATRVSHPLSVAFLLHVFAEMALALDYAHDAVSEDGRPLGIIHRDVSPQNILIGFNGVSKLTDFGVAKAANRGWETTAGIVKGKFGYMSPEQALGKKLDPRSDLFSLGIVMWEALTGRELFLGTTPAEILNAIVEQPIEPPSRVVSGLSSAVDPIVMKALKRSPSIRFQTGRETAQAIDQLLRDAGAEMDAAEVSRELAAVYAATIPDRALALRAAMADTVDVEYLCQALDAEMLDESMIPDSSTDSLDIFGLLTPAGKPTNTFDPDAVTNVLPAEPGAAFTPRAPPPRVDSSIITVAEAPDPAALREIRALDPEILDEDFDIEIVDGWDDRTQSNVKNDDLLELISDDDVRQNKIPNQFTGRFGSAVTRPQHDRIDPDFEGDETV